MSRICYLVPLLLTGQLACTAHREEPEAQERVTRSAVSAAAAPGFVHRPEGSLFHLGSKTKTVSEFKFLKQVGEHGVFALHDNGSAQGISNGDSPALLRPRFPGTAADHSARVRAYFLDAGLPQDQAGHVEVSSLVVGGGPADKEAPTGMNADVSAFYSKIHRTISGLPVVGSFAWARFNVDGETVSEEVYWPAIPLDVVQAAAALASSGSLAAAVGNDARVVIAHTPPSWEGPFAAFACVDAEDQSGTTRHFSADGQEMHLPHETRTPPEDKR